LNHIIPHIKLTTKQADQIDCGSETSNWIGKNKEAKAAVEADIPDAGAVTDVNFTYGPDYVYPF